VEASNTALFQNYLLTEYLLKFFLEAMGFPWLSVLFGSQG